MEIITRKEYADKVDAWIGKGLIIVITGQRRCGKSFILKDFAKRHEQEADAEVIYIDKEKLGFRFIRNSDDLSNYIQGHYITGKHNYILIDEVQDIEGWEMAVRSLRTEEHTDIIITGSNSHILSSELSTYLSGRYIEINVQSLSYAEFLQFHSLQDSDDSLARYMEYGGLPGLRQVGLEEDEMVWDYLRSVYNTVVLKDVVERHNIRNIAFLNNLVSYMADASGKPQSATNISNYMKSQRVDVSVNMVLDYLSYLCDAYLLKSVSRYDIHGKKLLEGNRKYYFGDIGLRNLLVGPDRHGDIEKVIETVVFQRLTQMGYTVYVGDLRAGEIDFVGQKKDDLVFVQVAYLITDRATEEREFGRLSNLNNHYPKYVISHSPLLRSANWNGIKHIRLRDFLLNTL